MPQDQGQIPNSLFLYDRCLTRDDCRLIIERFERRPFTEMTEGEHGEGLVAVNEEEINTVAVNELVRSRPLQ